MIMSDSIANITPALLKAQIAMEYAKKGSKNPYFKSTYADLTEVIEVCKDALNSNGVLLLQPIRQNILQTWLIHSSGEFMYSETDIICKEPNNPQAYGSAITYARRYGLQSILSIPTVDDDGNAASQSAKPTENPVTIAFKKLIETINKTKTLDDLDQLYENVEKAKEHISMEQLAELVTTYETRKSFLEANKQ